MARIVWKLFKNYIKYLLKEMGQNDMKIICKYIYKNNILNIYNKNNIKTL